MAPASTTTWTHRPTISAVVPTNRALPLIRPTLDALVRDDTAIEVLLVVDGPAAATLGADLDILDAQSPRVRVLRLPRRVGVESARRIGAEAALGEVVWMVDDDVVPDPGCGAGHAQAHLETGADLVAGPFTTSSGPKSDVPARLDEESFRHEWARFLSDPKLILSGFRAGNYSISRSTLLSIDVVPSVFQDTCHSDRAFGLMCSRAGLTAVARPELGAARQYARSLSAWRESCRSEGAGRAAIRECFADVVGQDAEDPWAAGLGRRGRLVLGLARSFPSAAAPLADALEGVMRIALRMNRHAIGVELGRVLRAVEQHRGARPMPSGARSDIAASRGHVDAAPIPADVSLLVVSKGPAARLCAVLETWRPHVAEIVVVADRSGESGLLDAVGALPDRTGVVESAFPIESVLERCWPLCRQPFVFRADDDEVPTMVLLAELRSLTLDPTLHQAGIPMRWLWPDAATWIDDYPWTANPQPKLMRNEAGLVRFPGRVHTAEHLDAPMRAVPLPIYHLRTLDPIGERRTRIAQYAAIGGGAAHFDGRPANSQYVPEDAGPLPLVAVAPWDAESITRVVNASAARLGAATTPSSGERSATALRPPTVLDSRPRLPAGGHRVSVRLRAVHRPVVATGNLVIEAVIANQSDSVLPGGLREGAGVSLSTRWYRVDSETGTVSESCVDGPRIPLGESIPPRRAVSRVVATKPPVGPGRWHVVVDLVEESVSWFGDGDECAVDIPVQ